jgi:tripartite-type tricarboxylate transporter receptor subunit TctC
MSRLILAALLLASGAAVAQDAYPSRAVTMVIPFPPGSISDVIGRSVAERLTKNLGQPVVVDNRPGANGGVGAAYVTRAKPDGYTFMMASNGIIILNRLLTKELTYEPADLAPLSLASEVPAVLVARKDLPANDLRGLIELAKKQPRGISYASGTATAQVAGETLKDMTGASFVIVPYKGEPPGLNDVVAGQVDVMVLNLPIAAAQIRGGGVKPIALVGARKVAAMPEIPLASDSVPGYVMPNGWTGFFAPAAVPAPIRERLSKEVIAALTSPEVKQRVEATPGSVLSAETPAELGARIASENATWTRLIKALKVTIQQ